MRKLLFIFAALFTMQAGNAVAADFKPYAGVGLGLFELNPGQNKKTTFGGFAFAGVHLNEYFATEFRVGTGGTKSREERGPLTEAFKVNWFVSVFAKPKLDVTSDFEVYGLLGITSMSASMTPAASVLQTSTTKTGLSFGVGAAYAVSKQIKIGAEWVRYASNADAATKNTTAFKGLDVNGFTTTIAYQF